MRRGIAAGMALAFATGGCALGARPAMVVSAAVFAASDRDRDGLLDSQEIAAMVDAAFPPEKRQGSGWDALRAGLIAAYVAQDRDGDGRLSRDELARALSSGRGRQGGSVFGAPKSSPGGGGVVSAGDIAWGNYPSTKLRLVPPPPGEDWERSRSGCRSAANPRGPTTTRRPRTPPKCLPRHLVDSLCGGTQCGDARSGPAIR